MRRKAYAAMTLLPNDRQRKTTHFEPLTYKGIQVFTRSSSSTGVESFVWMCYNNTLPIIYVQCIKHVHMRVLCISPTPHTKAYEAVLPHPLQAHLAP